jgi:cytochrome c oxidase subunit 1/cytochrome c oxidase subunit I+III
MLLTSVLDAEPDLIVRMPDDTLWPFLATVAITVLLAGLLLHLWWLAAAGGAAVLLCALGWLWPRGSMEQTARPGHG